MGRSQGSRILNLKEHNESKISLEHEYIDTVKETFHGNTKKINCSSAAGKTQEKQESLETVINSKTIEEQIEN